MNVLICDDDKYTRKMLEKVISKNPLIDKIFIAKDGLEAVTKAQNEKIHIALMDIDMPNLDGIEASKIMNSIIDNINFIFITAYVEYAIDSFCVHPYDYILKPVDIEHLEEALNRLISIRLKESKLNKEDKNTTFPIKQGQNIIILNKIDILFFEKSNKDVLIHTANEVFTLKKISLLEIENILDNTFFRSHRSFIINKKKIKEIKGIGNLSYNVKFIKSEKLAILSKNKYEYIKDDLLNIK